MPVASISGTPYLYTDDYNPCSYTTWYGSASSGTPGYTFNWYVGGAHQGSGSSLSLQGCYNDSITVRLVVTDAAGQTDDEYYTTTWSYTPNDPCTYDPYGCQCYYATQPPQESTQAMPRPICPYY